MLPIREAGIVFQAATRPDFQISVIPQTVIVKNAVAMLKLRSIPYLLMAGMMVYQFLKQKTGVSLITKTFRVGGSCILCKNRIEDALEVRGVNKAVWDEHTGMVSVTFNPKVISLDALKALVAKAGHDTDTLKAPDEAYAQLPASCQYERLS